MTDTPDTSVSDLALQKIGRNVLFFQKTEGLLKSLVASSHIEGECSEVQDQLDRLPDSKHTMGMAVGEFFEKTCSDVNVDEIESPPESKTPWMAFGFRILESEEVVAARKEEFANLVDERNYLVHHKLLEFDLHSTEACLELIFELDAQYDRIRPIHDYLKEQLNCMLETRLAMQKLFEKHESLGDHTDA